jgi:hypothetical protein
MGRTTRAASAPLTELYGCFGAVFRNRRQIMRSIFLWLIGVPIPIILLLALCTHHF